MLTRRSFIISAAAVAGSIPLVSPAPSRAVTPQPLMILGPQVDRGGSGVVPGKGISHQPGDVVAAATELSFLRSTDFSPAIALAENTLIARALGPDIPMVGINPTTGDELWRQPRTGRILGMQAGTVFYTTSPENSESLPTLKASLIQSMDDVWEIPDVDAVGGGTVAAKSLIYTEDMGSDASRLVSRSLRDGAIQWTVDMPYGPESAPATFATNGVVVVAVSASVAFGSQIWAWSADTGDQLWTLERDAAPYLSVPVIQGEEVFLLSDDGVQIVDSQSSEVVSTFDSYLPEGRRHRLAITEDAILVVRGSQIVSLSRESGELNWRRFPLQNAQSMDFLVCDGSLYRREDASDSLLDMASAIRAYDLESGQLRFEYIPENEEGEQLEIASFLVANQRLYLATNAGVLTVLPGSEALPEINDPVMSRLFENHELGFSYTWDDAWEPTGTSFLTPNGQTLVHESNGSVVTQSAGPASDDDTSFDSNWHASLGPDDRNIHSIQQVETPMLDFVPTDATIVAAKYIGRFSPPYDVLFGVRVLVPLADNNVLTFEFLQAESLFDDSIESFATFFENLTIS